MQSINTSFASVVSGGGNGERMNGTSPSSAGGHQEKGKARKRLQQQQQQQQQANDAPPQQANANNKITPLTQEQLQQARKQPLLVSKSQHSFLNFSFQAFEHLLRTDGEFVGRLHRAYIESLNSKLG